MSPEAVEIFKAVAAAVATVFTALLVFFGVVVSSRKPSTLKPPTGDTGKALEQFNGTQNEFMALVVADNAALRAGQERQEARIKELGETVESIKEHQETFLGAVRRYLMKLAQAWGLDTPMPWPDEDDFHILEDTLPLRTAKGKIQQKEER